jgi:hypothetical protein
VADDDVSPFRGPRGWTGQPVPRGPVTNPMSAEATFLSIHLQREVDERQRIALATL